MNAALLQTFLEVARTRHFGHSAENLFLTQSTVSSRIKQLEEMLGVPVFSRQKNNIQLTPAGKRLIPHAENILASWQQTIQEVGIPQQQSHQIALGSTANLWDTFLQSLLPNIAIQFDDLHIRTEVSEPEYLIRALMGGRLDIAILLDAPTNIDLEAHQIGNLELTLVCSKPEQSIKDIPSTGYILVDWGTAFNLQQAKLFSTPTAPILHTSQGHIALEFILGYQGAAFLPRTTVNRYLVEKKLFIIENAPVIQRNVYLLHAKSNKKQDTLEPIISFLKNSGIQLFMKNSGIQLFI